MSSLQEQLLKSGLVDRSRSNKAKKEKQKQTNRARHGGKKVTREISAVAREEQACRIARDRELNLKKQQIVQKKAVAAQVAQLVEANKLDRSGGDITYSFIYRKKVKRLLVSESIKSQLVKGSLVIVTCVFPQGRSFEIVPAAVARKIADRDSESALLNNDETTPRDEANDPYAAFQIPDDLIW